MRILLAAGLGAVAAALVRPGAAVLGLDGPRLPLAIGLAWLLFAAAALAVLRPGRARAGHRRTAVVVVVVAAACQLPGLLGPPASSDDAYRYVWDGRVQLAGISPYRYAPLDDRLAGLRDPRLFPGLGPGDRSGYRTPDALPADPAALARLATPDRRTRINRPRVPTIYPPLGQAWFTAVAAVTPAAAGTLGLQVAAAALAVAITAGLALLLIRRGRDPASALLWGWCPLVAHEAANGAHLDVLAAGLLVAAVAVIPAPAGPPDSPAGRLDSPAGRPDGQAGRGILGAGLLVGLAAAAKLTPLLLLPAFLPLRRGGARWLWLPVVAVLTLAAGYLPHVLAERSRVLGYLPGYLAEEGFAGQGSRYAVLHLLLPGLPAAALAATGLLLSAALAAAAVATADPLRPERTAAWLAGATVLVSTSGYPWYCLPLVALLVLAGRPEWLSVAAAASIVGYRPGLAGWCYLSAALVVAVVSVYRLRSARAGVSADLAEVKGPLNSQLGSGVRSGG